MGVIRLSGNPGSVALKDVTLSSEEQYILKVLRDLEWRYEFGIAAVDVPVAVTGRVNIFFEKMLELKVFGNPLGPYEHPPVGAETDHYEIMVVDAMALGVVLQNK